MLPQPAPFTRARRFLRYTLDTRATITMSSGDAEIRVGARTTDISEGGIGIMSPAELPHDGTVQIELVFPYTNESFKARAWVRNHVGFRYGLEFLRLKEDQMKLIRRFSRQASAQF